MNKIVLIFSVFAMVACQPPKNVQISRFAETMDRSVGRVLSSVDIEYLKNNYTVSSNKIDANITRYYIKMDNPNYIGGKGCEIYRDIDNRTNKIIRWHYISSPDKCRSRIGWGGPW